MPFRHVLALCAVFFFALAGCSRSAPPPAPGLAADSSGVEVPAVEPASAVIYELYVRSFTPEGTFRAIIPRLDELQALGVTTVWLMPIHPVGEARKKGELGSPYAVRDYRDVNPRFGTMDDFRALVEAVHERDMTILIDLVANHTAWDHAWIEEHPDWYTTDASGAITHPEGTDWTDVADLDFANPEVHNAMRNEMRFWVEEVGIDGFRCDVAELVPMAFWEEAISELRSVKPVLMLAEGGAPELHEVGFDLTYGWNTYNALKAIWRGEPATALIETMREEAAALPDDAARLRFTTNHDETAWDATPLDLFDGTEGAQAAAVIAATLPGAFLVYNGQEVGDTQQLPLFEKMDIDWDADPAMRAFYDGILDQRDRPAFAEGTIEFVEHDAMDDVLAYVRTAGEASERVIVNVRDEPVTVTLASEEQTLRPYEWRIEPQ